MAPHRPVGAQLPQQPAGLDAEARARHEGRRRLRAEEGRPQPSQEHRVRARQRSRSGAPGRPVRPEGCAHSESPAARWLPRMAGAGARPRGVAWPAERSVHSGGRGARGGWAVDLAGVRQPGNLGSDRPPAEGRPLFCFSSALSPAWPGSGAGRSGVGVTWDCNGMLLPRGCNVPCSAQLRSGTGALSLPSAPPDGAPKAAGSAPTRCLCHRWPGAEAAASPLAEGSRPRPRITPCPARAASATAPAGAAAASRTRPRSKPRPASPSAAAGPAPQPRTARARRRAAREPRHRSEVSWAGGLSRTWSSACRAAVRSRSPEESSVPA